MVEYYYYKIRLRITTPKRIFPWYFFDIEFWQKPRSFGSFVLVISDLFIYGVYDHKAITFIHSFNIKMNYKIGQICRVCLEEGKLTSIFTEEIMSPSLMILACTAVKVRPIIGYLKYTQFSCRSRPAFNNISVFFVCFRVYYIKLWYGFIAI